VLLNTAAAFLVFEFVTKPADVWVW